MGKLTRKEAEELHKIGRLDDKTMEVLENEGLVSRRARGVRRVMKTKNGNYVTPQLYFRGLNNNGNNEYSKKMTELRDKVNNLFNDYTTELNNNNK